MLWRECYADERLLASFSSCSKSVALMASTRVLESFGSRVDEEDVEQELKKLLEIFVPSQDNEHQWLMDLFAPQDAELGVRKADYLLRPLCEYVSVASQTHESVNPIIYGTVRAQCVVCACCYELKTER